MKALYLTECSLKLLVSMDVFIFKKIENQYYVNWYYFSIMIISILVIFTLLGYGSTSDWDELLYEQYNCDFLGQIMVAFPNDSSAYERYASCQSSSEITGFTPSFLFYLIVVAIAFGTRVMINWELEKPFVETELEEFQVSKKGYTGYMLFLLFTICCVFASLFLFYSQADDFHSSLSSLSDHYDDPDMPNWFLINLFLMLPMLLPLTALAILAYSGDEKESTLVQTNLSRSVLNEQLDRELSLDNSIRETKGVIENEKSDDIKSIHKIPINNYWKKEGWIERCKFHGIKHEKNTIAKMKRKISAWNRLVDLQRGKNKLTKEEQQHLVNTMSDLILMSKSDLLKKVEKLCPGENTKYKSIIELLQILDNRDN